MDDMVSRGWDELMARMGGPLTFRLVIQPAAAGFLAIRSGLRDAREGRPVFFWTAVLDPTQRRDLLRQGWKDVGKLFIVAVVLDVIYQVVVLHQVRGAVADRRCHAGRRPLPRGPGSGQPRGGPPRAAASVGRKGIASHGPGDRG